MPSPFDDLLEESRELERRARGIQGETELLATDDEIDTLMSDYHEWLVRALQILPPQHAEAFRFEFDGNFFQDRIKKFFESPGQPGVFSDSEVAGLPHWAHPFETHFRGPIQQQRVILLEARQELEGEGGFREHLELVERVARRLPDLVSVLANRGRGRPPFVIDDEYDLQDLLHGLLTLFFDDVRTEDFASERAGARSRIDFVLKSERLVVETKMTRQGLGAKQVGDELILDIERYRSHPDCLALLALVYDPDRRIVNARALETDLSGTRDGLVVRVVVVR